VVFWKYIRIFEGSRELREPERTRVFDALRRLAAWDEMSPAQEARGRKQAGEDFDYVRKFTFVDSRRPWSEEDWSKAPCVHWIDVVFTTLRKLDQDDFVRMNLPPEFWSKSDVPSCVREPLRVYARKLDSMMQDGVGVYLYGPAGVGKSMAAASMAKLVRSHGHSVFFVSVSDLMEMIRSRIQFSDDQSILDRCKQVDFLVLDNLRLDGLAAESRKEASASAVVVEDVLRHRSQWKRSTFLTSRVPPTERTTPSQVLTAKDRGADLKTDFAGVWEIARSACLWMEVTGEDRRRDVQKDLKARFVDKSKK